ncbi:MAG: MlaE family ABC transporter permease [Bacteroidota bacterium]
MKKLKKPNFSSLSDYFPENFNEFVYFLGEITYFSGSFFTNLRLNSYGVLEFFRQCYRVGNKSLLLVSITGFILGLVLTIQTRPMLAEFGAEAWVPGLVAVSIIREMGPVITALIIAGKVGSGFGAELGSMRVTEQIDAMEVSGTNPMRYLVVTRVLATTLMVPILVIYADSIAMIGSFIGINLHGKVAITLFINQSIESLGYIDIIPSTIKTFFFGFAIGIIGTYKGYYSGRGTEKVGMAANSAVVAASMAIFIIDLIAVQLTELFY